MLYLEQTRNRALFMAASTVATVTFIIATIQGINAVGVLLATVVINIFVYYALPDRYSKAYRRQQTSHYQQAGWVRADEPPTRPLKVSTGRVMNSHIPMLAPDQTSVQSKKLASLG